MHTLIEKISDLNDLIMQGQFKEAFEQFYHDELIYQFNDEQPLRGKETIRTIKEKELNDILEFKSAKPLKVTIGEQSTMVEWELNDEHRIHGARTYTQVTVQDWNQGLIIKEKMYCGSKKLEK